MVRFHVAWVLCMAMLWPASGQAKRSEDFQHSYEQVWRAAIRLIRVDQGFPIKDRDKDVGYFIFDYRDAGKGHPGTVELVQTESDEGRVKVLMQIPSMPSYIERMLLDKLKKKLTDDYGEPPNRAKRPSRSKDDKDEPNVRWSPSN